MQAMLTLNPEREEILCEICKLASLILRHHTRQQDSVQVPAQETVKQDKEDKKSEPVSLSTDQQDSIKIARESVEIQNDIGILNMNDGVNSSGKGGVGFRHVSPKDLAAVIPVHDLEAETCPPMYGVQSPQQQQQQHMMRMMMMSMQRGKGGADEKGAGDIGAQELEKLQWSNRKMRMELDDWNRILGTIFVHYKSFFTQQ